MLHKNTNFIFKKKMTFANLPELHLIGIGTRFKLILVVYSVALYTNKIPQNISEIINGDLTKSLLLKFYRNVSVDKIIDSFIDAFKKRNYNNENIIQEMIKILTNFGNLEYKDEIHIIWNNDVLSISKNNGDLSNIQDNELAKVIFKCYLDENSITEDLRKAIHS